MNMHFTQRHLNQELTYWAPTAPNRYGQPGFAPPQLIKGRWQVSNQQVRKANGEEIVSRAEVFVDRDLENGGMLAEGDHLSEATPIEGAQEIQDFRITPDLRNLGSERRAYL